MSRRDDICRAAISLASRGGTHSVTHQGIDRALGIAQGSTSYYYRSRATLITAVIDHLAAESRAEFQRASDGSRDLGADQVIRQYVERLVTHRREQVRARLALALDEACGPTHLEALASCLFSVSAAVELFRARGSTTPETDAHTLLDELEGRVLRSAVFGGN